MTFFKYRIIIALVFLSACEEILPGDHGISNEGFIANGVYLDPNFYLEIPPESLNPDQYIRYNLESISPMSVSSDTSYAPYSNMVSFSRYNCTTLQLNGIIGFKYYQITDVNLLNRIKPYSIEVNADETNPDNWELIANFIRTDTSIFFNFTDLTKKYILGCEVY